jgi:hypothetical protein
LVAINPALAAVPEIWRRNSWDQRELAEAVLVSASDDDVAAVVCGVVRARAVHAWSVLHRESAAAGVAVLVQAVAQDGWVSLAAWRDSIREALLESPVDLAALTPELMMSLCLAVQASDRLVGDIPFERWLAVPATLHQVGPADLRRRAECFLLALAFDTFGSSGAQLAASVFTDVYHAAEHDLEDDSWSMVSRLLPGSVWNWDRCQRLVEGAVRMLVRGRWPLENTFVLFKNVEAFERALDFMESTSIGRRTLSNMRSAVRQGNATAPDTLLARLRERRGLER